MATAKPAGRRRYSLAEVRDRLAEADGALASGESVSGICGRMQITRQTYYRWRRISEATPAREGNGVPVNGVHHNGNGANVKASTIIRGSNVALADRLKALEAENQRLRDAIITLMLEKMAGATK